MDRVRVKREFRKAWWICPSCQQEDFTDLNVGTPSTYTHNCSSCGKWSNSFKEYQGVLSYTLEEYDKIDEKAVSDAKDVLIEKWTYSVKNPPPYTEPTKAELEKLMADKQAEVDSLQQQISAKAIGE